MNQDTQAEQEHGTEQAHRWKRYQMFIETEQLNGEEYEPNQDGCCICQTDDQADIDRTWDACTRVTQEQYFLIVTPLDVEIEHKGPFYDYASMLAAARAHRQQDGGEDFKDALYWMKLHYGKPAFSFFTGAELDGDDDQPTGGAA